MGIKQPISVTGEDVNFSLAEMNVGVAYPFTYKGVEYYAVKAVNEDVDIYKVKEQNLLKRWVFHIKGKVHEVLSFYPSERWFKRAVVT